MADIHIGRISRIGDMRGAAALVYHIPVENVKAGVAPTPESSLSQLEQAEAEALAAGTMVEIGASITLTAQQSLEDVTEAAWADWHNVKRAYNERYAFEYKFYGVTLDADS